MANQVLFGFTDLAEVVSRRVTEVGVSVINTAVEQSIAEHNRQLDALMGLFVEKTTEFKSRYLTGQVARLQPLDERGRARPILGGSSYDVAWPILMAGTALGETWLAREKMTVQEANDRLATLLNADSRWIRDHILAALFDNAGWSFVDPEKGTLSILPLANGDAQVYQIRAGQDSAATDDHYLGQANAIGAGADNPFATLRTELLEHPENGGEVVVLVPTNLKASIVALTTFNPLTDPNITAGANADRLTGNLGVALPGDLFGYEDARVWLAEWPSLPDSRLIAVATEGPRALRMREDPEPGLRGFQAVAERNDHPFYERQYVRRAGFGAFNRVGAVVMEISDATYDVPTGYTNPMA